MAGILQLVGSRGLLITYGVAVGGYGLGRGINLVIAQGHLAGYASALLALLGWRFVVGLLILCRRIIIFAYGKVFLGLLQVFLGSATGQQCGAKGYAQGHTKGAPMGLMVMMLHIHNVAKAFTIIIGVRKENEENAVLLCSRNAVQGGGVSNKVVF